MSVRSRIIPLITVGVLAFLALGSVASAKPASILWSTTASTLTVAKAGKYYTVTAPANSPTVWFTDRPDRNAGSTTLQGFVGGWQQNEFDKVPPNAALVLRHDGTVMQSVVVLTRPEELANGSIRFRAKILPKGDVMDMKTMTMKLPTGTYRNAALFIDAGDAPACPAMITQPGWCTLSSSNYGSATTTVDLNTPNAAGITRTVQSCYWTGDHWLGAEIHYRDEATWDGSYTEDKTTSNCNPGSFSNLANATWRFAPVNTYFLNGAFRYTRNWRVTYTLRSRSDSYGGLWRFYSTPKVVIVVTDS